MEKKKSNDAITELR